MKGGAFGWRGRWTRMMTTHRKESSADDSSVGSCSDDGDGDDEWDNDHDDGVAWWMAEKDRGDGLNTPCFPRRHTWTDFVGCNDGELSVS